MWQALIPAVVSVIDKVLPDPQQAAEAKLRALELGQRGDPRPARRRGAARARADGDQQG